jgi:low affinity Fe/Cu permease
MSHFFRLFSNFIAKQAGKPRTFVFALFLVLAWALTGPFFDFSDTWQLVINTTTTIITFLMVFLIQNTQNRDSKAVHLKLDEILKSIRTARNQLVDIEQAEDEEMENLQKEFTKIRDKSVKEADRREKNKRKKN